MDEGDKRDGMLGQDSGDFGKSRSFPLISSHLSWADGWVTGSGWGRKERFGGDIGRLCGPVGGFGGAAFGVGDWTGPVWGSGLDPVV